MEVSKRSRREKRALLILFPNPIKRPAADGDACMYYTTAFVCGGRVIFIPTLAILCLKKRSFLAIGKSVHEWKTIKRLN